MTAAPLSPGTADLTVVNGLVFDGWSDEPRETSLYVRDGVIAEVDARVTRADRVLDARGRTVLPGLIDAHFHAYGVSPHGPDFAAGPPRAGVTGHARGARPGRTRHRTCAR